MEPSFLVERWFCVWRASLNFARIPGLEANFFLQLSRRKKPPVIQFHVFLG